MGQEQSTLDPRNVPGFNPEAAGSRGRAKPKAKAKAKAGPKLQGYFLHDDVQDHITPIHEFRGETRGDGGDGGPAEDVDLTALLESLGRGKKTGDSDDGLNDLKDIPQYDDDDGDDSDSGSDGDGGGRGMYHHDIQRVESEEYDVRRPEAHPISIVGDAAVCCVLTCEDQSPWISQFPIFQYEWFVSSELGNQTRFPPVPESSVSQFRVPAGAAGRFIQLRVSRRVEAQLAGVNLDEDEGGVYDAHVRAIARHTDKGVEQKFYKVQSTSIIGPVMISDETALYVTEALANGSVGVAAKLRDDIEETDRRDGDAKNRLIKTASYLKISYEGVEFQYEHPKQSREKQKSTMFGASWLKTVTPLGEGSSQSDGGAVVGPARSRWPLDAVQFRPSKSKGTIVMAKQLTKVGFSHVKKTQDLMRFDVDPTVGRDAILYTLIAFQAAVEFGEMRTSKWQKMLVDGDLDQSKLLIQRCLEGIMTGVSESAPAFEEMPETPWDY